MARLLAHIRGQSAGYVAIFIALGGSSYAALSIPRGSVGTQQLSDHSVTPVKLNPKYIAGSVHAWAIVLSDGKLIAGAGKPRSNINSFAGHYEIDWGVPLPRNCATTANIDYRSKPTETVPVSGNTTQALPAGYVSAVGTEKFRQGGNFTIVTTFNQGGQVTPLAFDLAVIC